MKLSLMAAKSQNGIIGNGPDIPWRTKGEQLLFKAMTYNQCLLVGRKTFESMGSLPNRKYAVISRSDFVSEDENVMVFSSIESALRQLDDITDYDIVFPEIPDSFSLAFEQKFESNINYCYQIWQKSEEAIVPSV
ncbi:dihydrofolate reductase [Moritella viscosa]|uniref:dihydrofolate reductase n=1 Tax=Moritella viscosa TaxID=80854 RepID=A0ABY1HIP5_9GAMM|nr:dihydrofolate reductase [Moritella viscosa]SGY97198.1 Dihydrofolate reductase [Moritella viscosa]SGZ10311.1 Dihydrofolate reductase [Moritella viscosa]SHO27445.1 Dihydrofolate reductase [Moritella viscosa]